MSDPARHPLDEARLRQVAAAFVYPPTPDIAGAGRARRRGAAGGRLPRWAVPVILAMLIAAALLFGPAAAAVVRSILRIGTVEIVVGPATPTPTARPATGTPIPPPGTVPPRPPSATPSPTETPGPLPVPTLVGRVASLDVAQARVAFPIRWPRYPPDLGDPGEIYLQDTAGRMAILLWRVPGHPNQARLVLYELSASMMAEKLIGQATPVQITQVSGGRAVWLDGPHMLQFYTAPGHRTFGAQRLVSGHLLAWLAARVTYRLETALPLEAAVRIAESVR